MEIKKIVAMNDQQFDRINCAVTSAVVQQLVNAQIAAGEGEEDYSALAKAIFKMANL